MFKRNDGACVGKNIINKYTISYLRLYPYALRLYHPEALQYSMWQSLMMYSVTKGWYNLNAYLSSSLVFSGVRVTRSLVLYVCFIDRCLFFCTFFFWPLCCLFFFDIRILITPLVSSNSSCQLDIGTIFMKSSVIGSRTVLRNKNVVHILSHLVIQSTN